MKSKSTVEAGFENTDEMISKIEGDSFIGRQKEINFFKHYITLNDPSVRILHIYGVGGIGKSFLLGEFSRHAKNNDVIFIKMDSGDYPHTPTGFSEHLLALLSTELSDIEVNYDHSKQNPYQYCLHVLSQVSRRHQIVIAIDTYNNMDELDRWFRQVFIRNLHPDIFIVLAGRKRLRGEWEQSPAWRNVTKQTKLHNFNFDQTHAFLKWFGIEEEQIIQPLWQFTGGHPLTLSLATLTNQELDLSNQSTLSKNIPQILMNLTKIWLQEVLDEDLLQMIELAALFNTFDQSSLSTVLNRNIRKEEFDQLISFSFINPVNDGWIMHDLIRDAVRIELQHRNPDRFKLFSDRLITYYYKKTIATRSTYNMSQFFYHVGDEAIQSAFFQDYIDTSMYLEPVGDYNFNEVISLFNNEITDITESKARFFDRTANKPILFHASQQHNRKESELIDETYIKKMGYDCAKLLKNKIGETLGISIVVPINTHTLKHLMNEPVSRAYFSNLSDSEFHYYNVPKNQNAGFFIRLLYFTDQVDAAARSYLLYNLFTYLLAGRKIIVSTPLPFFQDLLGRFGFTKVPGVTHDDYGKDNTSPTYLLDVSGANLAIYLKKFTESVSRNNQMTFIAETFSFTNREKEIVTLILNDKSNADIAGKLFIAEITVKKHITSILKKVNVKNRAQLIRRIMELI